MVEKEKEIYRAQAKETGKPEKVIEKIVEGKMEKFYKESCLMEQPYVKNPDITITDYINDTIAQTGESITIRRFARFVWGRRLKERPWPGPGKNLARVLLKMSGEALAGDRGYGLDVRVVNKTAQEIKEVMALGTRLGIVVGGGNIFRGVAASARGMDRIQADYLGMLATLFNAVAIRETLLNVKVPAVVLSALPIPALAETYYPQVGRAAWIKARSCCWPPEREIPILPPIRPRPCGPPNWGLR